MAIIERSPARPTRPPASHAAPKARQAHRALDGRMELILHHAKGIANRNRSSQAKAERTRRGGPVRRPMWKFWQR
jgi:hypothetical protein